MNDPFKIDGPTCISFSGGRTSAYMLWRVLQSNGGLPSEAVVCFANTGKEDERTLDFVHQCEVRWNIHIAWLEFVEGGDGVWVTDYHGAKREGEPFAALIDKKKFLPNAVMRFCTSDLKIKPIQTYMRRSYGDFDMMVGIRADEPRRAAKMPHLDMPLRAAGVTRQDVLAFWRGQPFDLDAEDGNCDLCFNKSLSQIQSSVRRRPQKAVWWIRQEQKVGATFAKDRPSYAAILKYVEDQYQLFDGDEAIQCFCGD